MVWSWCLLRASFAKHSFPFNGEDIILEEGEFITGRNSALRELRSLTPQKYRTAIAYLKSTSRITIRSNNKFSIIKINKWSEYQSDNNLDNQPVTSQQPASNQQITTYNKDKKEKKDNNIESRNFVPPSVEEVSKYCVERNNQINAEHFIDFYSSKGWLIGKNKMKDWRAAVRTWESRKSAEPEKEDDYIKKLQQKYGNK
jgi:hypothetical protein